MAIYLRDGFRGTCTSPASGTGPYTSIAAVSGYRSFATLTDGDQVLVGVRSATTWGETGVYTKSGGSTPTLTRTRVDITVNGNTSPYDWPPGTPLIIYSTLNGADAASLLGANTWQQDQSYNGKKLRLSPDTQTYIDAQTNGLLEMVVANVAHTTIGKGGANENYLSVQWADNGAATGPYLVLERISTSPTASDLLGSIDYRGRNSSGALITYAQLACLIKDGTVGSEDGALQTWLMRAGARTLGSEINDHFLAVFPTVQNSNTGILVGKSAQGTGAGLELLSNGQIAIHSAADPIQIDRTGSDGNLILFSRDAAVVGSISVSGATVAYNPFLGAHYSEWHASVAKASQWEEPGTVVCTADGSLPGFGGRLPLVVPSTFAGDKRVYGAVHARLPDSFLQIAGVGAAVIKVTGDVEAGDYLETSDVPGAARVQVSESKTNATIAKATQNCPDDGMVRLCSCTFEAG